MEHAQDVNSGRRLPHIGNPVMSVEQNPYFRHDRIRRSISSFDINRPLRESSKPRSIMRSKASSRIISSQLASSGCDWIISVIFSFTFDVLHTCKTRHDFEFGIICCVEKRWPPVQAFALEGNHHAAGLLGVHAATQTQVFGSKNSKVGRIYLLEGGDGKLK